MKDSDGPGLRARFFFGRGTQAMSREVAPTLGFILWFALMGLLSHGAHGHDYKRPDLNNWFMGLRSPGHGPCCDGSEAHHLAGVDWETKDGHYRVRLDNKWYDVPDDALVDGPNLEGEALVWPFKKVDGDIYIRCFMPGTLS